MYQPIQETDDHRTRSFRSFGSPTQSNPITCWRLTVRWRLLLCAFVVLLVTMLALIARLQPKSLRIPLNSSMSTSASLTSSSTSSSGNARGQRFLLLAYMRSGSTLTSEILTLNPTFNYMFEPLWIFRAAADLMIGSEAGIDSAARLLTQLFNCDALLTTMVTNTTFVNVIRFNYNTCWKQPLLIKTIRVHGTMIHHLLQYNPDLKVIHLVRDPRAILMSRLQLKTPMSAASLCGQMRSDLEAVRPLTQHNVTEPRYIRVRYEDLVNKSVSNNVIKGLYNFMGVPLHLNQLEAYWSRHSKKSMNDSWKYETFRGQDYDPNQWRQKLELKTIRAVETECHEEMQYHGYARATSL